MQMGITQSNINKRIKSHNFIHINKWKNEKQQNHEKQKGRKIPTKRKRK